jgi:hypothetical protein
MRYVGIAGVLFATACGGEDSGPEAAPLADGAVATQSDAISSMPNDGSASASSDSSPASPQDGNSPSDAGGQIGEGGKPSTGVGLSGKYPGDNGIENDPDVLFHSDFENGFAGWTRHSQDKTLLDVDTNAQLAHGGTSYMRASISRTRLAQDLYIGVNAQFDFAKRVPVAYWRFYARFVANSAPPHHWVRLAGGNPTYQSDGLANTKPPGDQGFWYDLDAHDDGSLNFYVYWYKMRSGRCNDGSTTPGCAGDQGTTYFYGNNFTPAGQKPFPRDMWMCLELMTKVNTVGQSDGELALWMNDALVGEYKPGTPHGRWLRDNFYSWGPYFQDNGGFEGFDFRSDADVLVKRITLDTYYEKGSLDTRIANGLVAPETQTILYDDVVVATSRVGCMAP